MLALIVFNAAMPAVNVLAANGSWSQTTFTGSGDGTYTNTAKNADGTSVGLMSSYKANTGIAVGEGFLPNQRSVVRDSSNVLHVVYSRLNTIYYVNSSNEGRDWSSPYTVHAGSATTQLPEIILDDSNNIFVLWSYGSSDNGQSFWRKRSANGAWNTASAYTAGHASSDESAAHFHSPIDANNNIYAVYDRSHLRGNGIKTFNGTSWSSVTSTGANVMGDAGYQTTEVIGTNLYHISRKSSNGYLYFEKRESGVWNTAAVVGSFNGMANSLVDRDGNIRVFSNDAGASSLRTNRYVVSSGTWDGWSTLATGITLWTSSSTMDSSGNLYIFYVSGENIYYRFMPYGGSWQSPVQVTSSAEDGVANTPNARFQNYHHQSPDNIEITYLIGSAAPYSLGYAKIGGTTSGSFTSDVIAPEGIYGNWESFVVGSTLNGKSISIDVLDGVTGNTFGFPTTNIVGSPQTIDLSSISSTEHPSLKFRANFSTNDPAIVPLLDDWQVNYNYDLVAPTSPSGLTVDSRTSNSVDLSWQASMDAGAGLDPVNSYYIERATDSAGTPGSWTEVGTSNTTSYTATGLAVNTKYYFRVKAKDGAGNYSGFGGISQAVFDGSTDGTYINTITKNSGADVGLSGGTTTFTDNFSTSEFKDSASTTANWDTVAGTVTLPGDASTQTPLSLDALPGSSSAYNYSMGYRFTVNTSGTITRLGRYGITAGNTSPTIDLWSDAGTLLATATANTSAGWQWGTLSTPVNVTAGQIYRVSVRGNGSYIMPYRAYTTPVTKGGITINSSVYSTPGGTFPATTITSQMYGWADIELSVGSFTSPATAQSLEIDSTTENISRATLTATQALNGQSVSYSMSPNGGANWEAVSTGVEHIFINQGSDLRWRAVISSANTSATPVISQIQVSYISGPLTGSYVPKPISKHSSGSWRLASFTKLDSNNGGAAGTTLTLDVLDSADSVLLTNIPNNHDLSGITDNIIKLRANFATTDQANTPLLRDFAVTNSDTYLDVYTTTAIPTLSVPASPQRVAKPTITGTGATPSTTVKLYDNGVQKAEVTSAGDGTFTFNSSTPGYTALAEGEHTNITVRGYGNGGETDYSNAVPVFVDTVAPTAPTTRDAAKVADVNGNNINDAAWNGNNNTDTVYFAWSGATDAAPASNIKRYWVYFGPLAGGVPRTDGQATANATATATKTLSSPVSGTDYYLRIQTEDNAGNISSDGAIPTLFVYKFDNTPPVAPASINVKPVGWSTEDPFVFTWSEGSDADSGLWGYAYKRANGVDEWTYVADNDPDTASVDHYQAGVNYFLLSTVDKAGNISNSVNIPYLYSGNVGAPQNLSVNNSQSQGQTVNRFQFSWNRPALGSDEDYVGYYYSVNDAPNPGNSLYTELSETEFGPFAKTNDNPNTFFVVAKDVYGNIGWNNPAQISFIVNTVAPSVPQNVSITDASDRGTSNWALTVKWSAIENPTPDFNGYEVWRCDAPDNNLSRCDSENNFGKRATVTTNIYSESGLDNNLTYSYKIKSNNNVGNTSGLSAKVSRKPTGKYTTPPSYTSEPKVSVKAMSSMISWTTNRPSNTIVQYGTGGSYNQEASKSTEEVTDHSIEIFGLNPGTKYSFKVQSLDAERDYAPTVALSAPFSFSTLPAPGISEVEATDIGLTSAIVTWKTTSAATSTIKYGTSTAYGSEVKNESGSAVTTHTIRLPNLNHSTVYNFKVTGTDVDGNYMESDNYVFSTLVFPVISNVRLEGVKTAATSTMKLTWDSNVPMTSVIEYRTSSGGPALEDSSAKLVTKHEMTVSGLRDNTEYIFAPKGRDAYGNQGVGGEQKVKTDFDTRPPKIFNVTIETETAGFGSEARGQIIISWETDEPATSQIEYGLGSSGEYSNRTQEDTSLKTSHVVIISDLKTSSPYHLRIVSSDESENEGFSDDYATLTAQANTSVLEAILGALQNAIGWMFGG